MRRSQERESDVVESQVSDRHPGAECPPYGLAAVAFCLVFGLYAVTLAPTAAFWDASEYIATAHILGIPHPPGNPLFVVLARAWEVLLAPLGLPPAVRINLFSAFMGAAAHGFWFLVVHHILGHFSKNRWFRVAGAAAAILVSATAFTVWNQSNVNEKVYTVSLFTIALISWLAIRWQQRLGEGKENRILLLAAFALALSVGNHLMAFLAAPAFAVFVLVVRPQTFLKLKLYPGVVAVGLLGLSIHLFLPIRAALDPIINQVDPTCKGVWDALQSVATYGRAGCENLSRSITRDMYLAGESQWWPRKTAFSNQLVNYLQYFDWQWARSMNGVETVFANARLPFTMLFTGLGVWGALEHADRDRPSFWYVATLFATVSVGLIFYLNFNSGYTFPDPTLPAPDLREVRERDYFYIVSFSIWGVWAGIGISSLWLRVKERTATTWLRASPVLGLALLPLALNWSWASRAGDFSARDWAYNLLQSVEPYGVLITNGDNDTFPLWYLQEVEGLRRDVTVIVPTYFNSPWYVKQLRDQSRPCPDGIDPEEDPTRVVCQRPYTPERLDSVYTASPESVAPGKVPIIMTDAIRQPARPIVELTDDVIDEVATRFIPLEVAQTIDLGGIQAQLPGGAYVYPWHQFALATIRTSLGDRPVYFSSSGNAASELGLEHQLIRHGLAFKLHPTPMESDRPSGVVDMPPGTSIAVVAGPRVDVARTKTLLDEVFRHRSDLPDWPWWPDRASIGIPSYYAWAYFAVAQGELSRGAEDEVERYVEIGQRWADLGS